MSGRGVRRAKVADGGGSARFPALAYQNPARLIGAVRAPDGILAGLWPGSVYVDMSTVSPQASRELATRVHWAGATMIDAPVSGSVPAAENGTLAIMAGGPDEAFQAVVPLLRRLGSSITHVGGNGQGLLLKLAINVSLAAQMLAFSEGMLLAERGDAKLVESGEVGRCETGRRVTGDLCSRSGHDVFII